MREIRTFGSMSGERKQSVGQQTPPPPLSSGWRGALRLTPVAPYGPTSLAMSAKPSSDAGGCRPDWSTAHMPTTSAAPAAGSFSVTAHDRIVFGVPAGEAVVAEAER